MLSVHNLALELGGRPILRGFNLSVADGECVAIVGPNGCGKSSFLRILAGRNAADSGTIHLPAGGTIGYLPQEADLLSDETLGEELLKAFANLREAMDEMQDLEHRMGTLSPDSSAYQQVLQRYADLSHIVEHGEGYQLEVKARRVAAGLGFTAEDMHRQCSEFSGGWQMRILLAKVLLQNPDLLLLDEPTNHLDLESMLWLEEWIRTCKRTVLMVSHERSFMDRLAQRIVCLESGRAEIYRGDYSHYLAASAARREAQWQAYERQRQEIEQIEAFIRRFRYNAARAAQVQSRIKQLEKVERLEPPFHPTAIHFDFPPAPPSHQDVLAATGLGHRYGELEVFSGVDLVIRRGEKVGLVGVNGAGKSTLLRLFSQREKPSEGMCEVGGNVKMAYFAQYDSESLTSDQTLLAALEEVAPVGQAHRARDVLGAFLFTGDAVLKPLRALSGGERTRFRLARMLFSPANLLILDEPTNHLDVTSRATVEEALRSYKGTVVLVSHDPVFMNRVTGKVVEIADGALRVFPGSYADYLADKERQTAENAGLDSMELSKRSTTPAPKDPAPQDKASRQQERELKKAQERDLRKAQRAIEKLESEIEKTEARLEEVNQAMADPDLAKDFARLAPLIEEQKQLRTHLERSILHWEQLHEEVEQLL